MSGLDTVYSVTTPDEARDLYDSWAERYDAELSENGYATPTRCAVALAQSATAPTAPMVEFGCGTGLGGAMLRDQGFTCIDGFDLSLQMLERARNKDLYRNLDVIDLSQPITAIEPGLYQNAAAIGVLNPAHLPTTAIDEVLGILPSGGCFVLSLNDHSLADGSMETRLLELTEYNIADLVFKEHGEHLPGIDLTSSVYVLRKR